jgi:excisionase family DNA binding protein
MNTQDDFTKESIALLSINKAAEQLKLGKKRIYELIDNGEIGIIEFENGTIKIPESELQKWIQRKLIYKQLTKTPENGKMIRTKPAFNAQSVMNKIIKRKGTNE